MKAVCYISNFSENLDQNSISELISNVDTKNKSRGITGLLIIRNKHFFQILEGKKEKIDELFEIIRMDSRHRGIIKLLDTRIEDRIFKDYNSGEFDIFHKFADMKKLYLYFNWIKYANYLPADELIQLTTNFLKHNR